MIQAILLAAGRSERFGGDKLLQPLSDGQPVGLATARILREAMNPVLVVVRPGAGELHELLLGDRFDVRTCPRANEGMGASLAFGVGESAGADGWLVALADMPFVQVDTIAAVVRLIEQGADISAPAFDGRRGHPVAFSSRLGPALRQLRGDTGARGLIEGGAGRVRLHPCADPGCLRDIDTPADLASPPLTA